MAKLQMNQFSQTPLKGAVYAVLNDLTLSCQVDPASVATLVPGTKVKFTTAVGNTLMIDAAIASDPGVGFVAWTPKKETFKAGDPVEILFLLSTQWMEASGSINRGDQLESVATGAKVKTNAGNPICGVALDNAADGDIFRILVAFDYFGTTAASGSFTTLSASGASTLTGNVSMGGTLTVTGLATLPTIAATAFTSTVVGPGTGPGSVVYCKRIRTTIANVNSGAVLVAAITGRKIRLVDAKVIAIGAAVTSSTATGVAITATQTTTVNLLAHTKAVLTQSTVNGVSGTGATVLADGASFIQNDVTTGIGIASTGSGADLAGASNIDVILSYVVE